MGIWDKKLTTKNKTRKIYKRGQITHTKINQKLNLEGGFFVYETTDTTRELANFALKLSSNFLEIGCGEGYIAYVISKKVKNLLAVDISKKTIDLN